MLKTEIRKQIKQRLALMSEQERAFASQKIANSLFSMQEFIKAKHVFVYLSFSTEVQTDSIVKKCVELGKNVAIPLLLGDKMVAVAVDANTKYSTNQYGIKEPCGTDLHVVDTDMIELAIIPLVGFDDTCMRLGRGKGFYDGFLKDNIFKLALAFETQKVTHIPCEGHDVRMNKIVTESCIYGCNNG